MNVWYIIVLIIVLKFVEILFVEILNNHRRKNNLKIENYYISGNVKESILSKSELECFRKLKRIIDKNKYSILIKIRLADVINIEDYLGFSSFKSIQFDFIITNLDFSPLCAIEFDDYTNKKNRYNKKDIICDAVNLKLIKLNMDNINRIKEYLPN